MKLCLSFNFEIEREESLKIFMKGIPYFWSFILDINNSVVNSGLVCIITIKTLNNFEVRHESRRQ